MTEPEDDDLGPVDDFFVESTGQSRTKTNICTDYFLAWERIITPRSRTGRVGYVDVYVGPGRYMDGTKSSPLLILERAIADPRLGKALVTVFNDAKPEHTESLQKAIKDLRGIEALAHRPYVITTEVGPRLVAALEKPMIPTFAFIDPYGYKGLSLGLINAAIKDWACECLFLFNYNRINPGISNAGVTRHMEALFGPDRLAALRAAVRDCTPQQRERKVMGAVIDALLELGGKYVLPFRFKMENSDRTSHYLIFVSKAFLGYEIMREVMCKASSSATQGVPSFEYDPRDAVAPRLFEIGHPLDDLVEALAVRFPGRTLAVRQIFEIDSPGKFYVLRNYKDALLQLERDGRALMDPPADRRRKIKGKLTLSNDVVVSFRREPRQGAKIEASRSTPARPAAGHPPSVSARPTA